MAGAVVDELAHIEQRLFAAACKLVVGGYFQIFLIVFLGGLELALEAVHLGKVVIDLGLDGIVLAADETAIVAFSLHIVVHKPVAFRHLEIDAVFLHLVGPHLAIGLLVFLEGGNILALGKQLVGFLGHTIFLCDGGTRTYYKKKEQQ